MMQTTPEEAIKIAQKAIDCILDGDNAQAIESIHLNKLKEFHKECEIFASL